MEPRQVSRALAFWYDFASSYAYLTCLRIEDAAADARVPLIWKPFLLGPLFRRQGWSDSPFNLNPVRGTYMWRDVERHCALYGLPFMRPSRFPRQSLHAARIACLASSEPWLPEFSRAVYVANFGEDRDIAEPALLALILDRLGQDGARWVSRAGEAESKERLRRQTEEAWSAGVFGAPTFLVDGEVFWGNDRLDQALAWAKGQPAADLPPRRRGARGGT
jgi:2-hydroxychromene-2-carboxylate isomerase